jgi:hypothetical protein
MGNFLTQNKLTLVEAATAAGTTDVESAIVDCAGYQGVVFFTTFGVITAGAVTSIKVQQDIDAAGATMADLLGSGITVADDDDGQTFAIEIYRPRERYLRCVVDRATQNAVVGEIYAIRYGARTGPQTNTVTDLLTAEIHVGPAEGTA